MQGIQIVLTQYPQGMPGHDDLKPRAFDVPSPGDGEVQLRTIYLSLDPYMRGRMSTSRSYATGLNIGDVITAEGVSEVLQSKHENFRPGDIVLGRSGWQTHSVLPGQQLRKLDPAIAPISTALGVLGMPGFTAYVGLKIHGQPKSGETVVVSAAAGAVGQIVGQLARQWGCRAIGIAGGAKKNSLVTGAFGFEACVDYKAANFRDRLIEACPTGIDIYFENVGGDVLKTVIPLMNEFGRIPVCGAIAYYNLTELPEGPDFTPVILRTILTRRLRVHGFINYDHIELHREFIREMSKWVADGTVRYVEDVVSGIENAVDAFRGLLKGKYTGKVLIKVGEDPTAS